MIVVFLFKKPDVSSSTDTAVTEGCGGINIEDCSIARSPDDISGWASTGSRAAQNTSMSGSNYARLPAGDSPKRWPANLFLANMEVVRSLDAQGDVSVAKTPRVGKRGGRKFGGQPHNNERVGVWHNDGGGVSRFFKKVVK